MNVRGLRELARLYSIQISYEDAAGKTRKASRESLLAALRARIPDDVDLKEAWTLRRRMLEERVIEPVTVVWGERRPRIDVRMSGAVQWRLTLEDGSIREGRGDVVNGSFTLPERVPLGYHTLGVGSLETFLIAAPMEAPAPKERSWGAFVPLYAVRSQRNWGAGDLGDMESVRSWIHEAGGGVVATLPLLAAYEDEPSPYSPVSRLYWNELYLELERLPEWSSELRDERTIAALQNSNRVDYEHVNRARRRALEVMAKRFRPDDDFRQFASGGGYAYAHFRAAKEERESAGYHLYVQYRMARQMRALADEARRSGVGLYLDFPLGVNPEGYDAWKYGRAFAKGVSAGAPPDLFFTKGQNWGFAPFDPDRIRDQRYDYFRAAIRHHVSHSGILRLDHVMGLHRLFWIPEGVDAADGVYVRYREEEMYAIVVLEAHRHGCAVVGEDLGTVPDYVPRMMLRHGLRRMYVVQYEIRPEGGEPAGTPQEKSVASVNTHDMPTFAGFWSGTDIDDRVEQELLDSKGAERERETREQMRQALTRFLAARGLLENGGRDTKAVLEALLRFLSASPAEIVLVNLEDLWLERAPQNVPGVPERSWRQKFARTLEEMRGDADLMRILHSVHDARKGVHGNTT